MTQLKDSMSNIEKVKAEIERLENMDYPCDTSEQDTGFYNALDCISHFIDSLPEDASCTYDTNKLTPTPSVNIEDVARVQFASHAHVFDRKRKAVFDWEQFKEVAGIFYGFGKRDSLPEEKPSEDLKMSEGIMSNEEIDKWVEEHIVVPPDDELSEARRLVYTDIVPSIIQWGKIIAHKFYGLGKQSKDVDNHVKSKEK